jgi:hypothetical protein
MELDMSTTVAISAAAMASSAAANSAAQAAKKNSCSAFELSYRPDLATVGQKQQYAECIELLYPQPSAPLAGAEIIVAKIAIVILLIAFVVGAVKGWREGYGTSDRIVGAVLTGLMGWVCVAVVALILGLAIAGTAYLFS